MRSVFSGVLNGSRSTASASYWVIGAAPPHRSVPLAAPRLEVPPLHRRRQSSAPLLLQTVDGRGDAFVGGRQRHPNVLGATCAVELAGCGQNATLRQPADGVAARLAAGPPEI